MQPTILIIDDETGLRELLARMIRLEGFEVVQTGDLASAKRLLGKQSIEIVLCDVKLPDGNGVDFVDTVKKEFPSIEILLLTAYGNIPDGVQAMRLGAFDYLVKGDDNNRIIPALHKMVDKIHLQRKVMHLEKQLGRPLGFDQIIGQSPAFRQVIDLAQKVAPTDTAVLLHGETGTGKEVFAQAIHQASRRAGRAFIALNCSAFSHDLLESELFGHRAGAFTGALKDKPGLLDEAQGGTLFLDEIGEMPFDLQAKLLRVLETGEYLPVGDTKIRRADIRLLSATNRPLLEDAEAGRFRADLYYRLAVFQIHLPALRERRQDIALLARHFTAYFSAKMGKKTMDLTDEFLHCLENYPWRGNIRELRNVIERAIILSSGAHLTVADLPGELQSGDDRSGPEVTYSLETAECRHIQKVLLLTGGNKTEAARLLGIGLTTLYRKIESCGLSF
ncbi:MAG: sigma-54-dependent Fis family transcriptional regulator [Saprospiraceae bacterium]|nr:sigma-54-dependent Fis family transcriptional regulator [Saprospiraceae bacterium]